MSRDVNTYDHLPEASQGESTLSQFCQRGFGPGRLTAHLASSFRAPILPLPSLPRRSQKWRLPFLVPHTWDTFFNSFCLG